MVLMVMFGTVLSGLIFRYLLKVIHITSCLSFDSVTQCHSSCHASARRWNALAFTVAVRGCYALCTFDTCVKGTKELLWT